MITLQNTELEMVAGGFVKVYDSVSGYSNSGEPFSGDWQAYLGWLEENPGMTYADFKGL